MTALDLVNRTLKRLDQDTAAPVYYTKQEILNALNKGQRLFAFATLCLETIVSFPLTPGTAFQRMLSTYPDWLLPLRVYNAAGAKVRPATLDELHGLDDAWRSNRGATTHYGCLGFDLLFTRGSTDTLSISYAKMPATLAADGDQVEIIDAYQPCLIDYAIWRVRSKQGGQEFAKAGAYLQRFLGVLQGAAEDTRQRAIAAGNDRMPFELEGFLKLAAKKAAQPEARK